MQVKMCSNCTAENTPDSAYCAKCGSSLADVQISESAAAAAPVPAPAKSGVRAWVSISLLVVIVSAAFSLWWFVVRDKGPGGVASQFIAAIGDGDARRVASMLTKVDVCLLEDDAGGVQHLVDGIRPAVVQGDLRVARVSYEGDKAIVKLEMCGTKPDGTISDKPEDLVLVQEDGKWKIDLIATLSRANTVASGQ
jgi:hypothetical protein